MTFGNAQPFLEKKQQLVRSLLLRAAFWLVLYIAPLILTHGRVNNSAFRFLGIILSIEAVVLWRLVAPRAVLRFARILRVLGWSLITGLVGYIIWGAFHGATNQGTMWSSWEGTLVLLFLLFFIFAFAIYPTFSVANECTRLGEDGNDYDGIPGLAERGK